LGVKKFNSVVDIPADMKISKAVNTSCRIIAYLEKAGNREKAVRELVTTESVVSYNL
jgi:hypothetical protein